MNTHKMIAGAECHRMEIEKLYSLSPYFPEWYSQTTYYNNGQSLLLNFSTKLRYKHRNKWYVLHCVRFFRIEKLEYTDLILLNMVEDFIRHVYTYQQCYLFDKTRAKLDEIQISEVERIEIDFLGIRKPEPQ